MVVHRQNLSRLDEMIALAEELGVDRLEIAHVQYYGWALHNRARLLPTRMQWSNRSLSSSPRASVSQAASALILSLRITMPGTQGCMGGWGRKRDLD